MALLQQQSNDEIDWRQHSTIDLSPAIARLKKQKNAVLLAHYYQEEAIQDVADYVGDSLGLSRQAAATDAHMIVFAGVHFMAETAKILSPDKKVLLPDKKAGCSLADACPPDQFRQFIDDHPYHKVVSYVNCSAEVKAMSDIICTSSNAEKVIATIPEDKPIIFAPDKHLGGYLIAKTGRDMLLWDGVCQVHDVFSREKIYQLKQQYPDADVIAHPECGELVRLFADFIGSTGKLLDHVRKSQAERFIVVTEPGIIHQLKKEMPSKEFLPGPPYFDNHCACSECAFMKMNTLQKVYDCLDREQHEIELTEEVMKKAKVPIERMLAIS